MKAENLTFALIGLFLIATGVTLSNTIKKHLRIWLKHLRPLGKNINVVIPSTKETENKSFTLNENGIDLIIKNCYLMMNS